MTRRTEQSEVVVVGGGLAGCAAATILAERGVRVTVVEKESYLGGRVGSWNDCLADGTPFQMERGFHAFFRQYYNVRALMRRVDPNLARLRPVDDYPLIGSGERRESFAGLSKRLPLNFLQLVWRTPSLRLRDLWRVDAARATEMLAFDPSTTYARWDARTAREYLDSLGFPPRAREMLFDIFAHSFFNPEDEYSAAELLAMFHFYFLGNPEGLVFDVLDRPFEHALFGPLRTYLERLGVRFVLERAVHAVAQEGERFVVRTADDAFSGDAVVLAVTVPALQALVDGAPSLGSAAWRAQVDSLDVTRRFAVLRLWVDGRVHTDRAPFAGTTGLGILDNISVYEKLEDESTAWAARTGGSVLELHAYAIDDDLDEDRVRTELLAGLHAAYPETKTLSILEERLLVRRDCPAFAPGSHALRPGVRTGMRGLYLAGDFVKLDIPSALMERAVASGFTAANGIAEELGLRPEPISHVPRRGALSSIGALAARRP